MTGQYIEIVATYVTVSRRTGGRMDFSELSPEAQVMWDRDVPESWHGQNVTFHRSSVNAWRYSAWSEGDSYCIWVEELQEWLRESDFVIRDGRLVPTESYTRRRSQR